MRGKPQAQSEVLTINSLNQRASAGHPLRGFKERVDKVLAKLSTLFDQLYAGEGRPSIPPEQLTKSRILMTLYSVRSKTSPPRLNKVNLSLPPALPRIIPTRRNS
jgi:transposase